MPRILELDPHVADLIAAGEVVERSASVVKELMENSIDAGAGIVTAEITAGGMTFIRVSDNGCGIAPEDVKTAFRRHATSKLRDADGLAAIGTLGFRGEALAAIASVSRIELITRAQGASEGVRLSLEGGNVIDMAPVGCPEGTTIIVRDLFFNTPARLKFMKSDRAESAGAASAALRCALSRPDVSVRFVRDGKTEFHTPGDSRVESCIYTLFGREFSAGVIFAESSDEAISVSGFVSTPETARGNRSYQFFFVNGRPIRSVTLQAALEQAFANTLPKGRFPSCALYITARPCDVDVNVHPAKTEIKFVSDKQVFDGVYYATLGALGSLELAQSRELHSASGEGAMRLAPHGAGGESGRLAPHGAGGGSGRLAPHGAGGGSGRQGSSGFESLSADEFRQKYHHGNSKPGNIAVNESPPLYRERNTHSETDNIGAQRHPPLSTFHTSDPHAPSGDFRIIGEALDTYIIIERENAVWFIDKHAAHERIHFDALKSGNHAPMSQSLITPIICRLGLEDASALLENADMLDKLGFTVESFGEDAIAVRRIPEELDAGDVEAVLSETSAALKRGGTPDNAQRDSIYRTIACKAAIKAGRMSAPRELEALATRVVSGEITHCPHGRPVAYELTKSTLDKGFKRI